MPHSPSSPTQVDRLYDEQSKNFGHWEKIKDIVDQCLDMTLNYRQSGHPGGSRSKVPLLVANTLGAGMRWDVRRPESAFGDRFVLVAGHCAPAVYALLAVYNEALALRYQETGDERYLVPNAEERALRWHELLWLRHNGHLAGHRAWSGRDWFRAGESFFIGGGHAGNTRARGTFDEVVLFDVPLDESAVRFVMGSEVVR